MALSEGFFDRFKKIVAAGPLAKKRFLEVCKEKFNVTLSESEVELKDSTIKLTASSGVKNRLFTIQKQLLEELRAEGSPIREIRF